MSRRKLNWDMLVFSKWAHKPYQAENIIFLKTGNKTIKYSNSIRECRCWLMPIKSGYEGGEV